MDHRCIQFLVVFATLALSYVTTVVTLIYLRGLK